MNKLSIITICYNEPDLEKTCESIINQTFQDFEWIVIDGGSNDEIQKQWEIYKHRIDKFISEPDKGIYDAYNKGLNFVSGEYVIFMNAGDSFYDNDVLKKVFDKNNKLDADVLYGETNLQFKNGEDNKIIQHQPRKINKYYFINNNINTQSLFVKKTLFDLYGNFDLSYRILGDLDRLINFICNGATFKYLPLIVSNYDMQGISSNKKTRIFLIKKKIKFYQIIILKKILLKVLQYLIIQYMREFSQ